MTDHAAEYLDHGADLRVLGEGEETLCELLDALEPATATPYAVEGLVVPRRSR